MNLDLRHPRAIQRTRNARRAIVLAVALAASLLFANLATKAWSNVTAHQIAHQCGAC